MKDLYTEHRYQTTLLKNSRVQVKLFDFSTVIGTQLLYTLKISKSTEIVTKYLKDSKCYG